MRNPLQLEVLRLGRQRYLPIWDLQRRFQQERIADLEAETQSGLPDRLLLVEHEPVFTWGKRTKPQNLGAGPEALRGLGAVSYTHLRAHETVL